MIDLRPDLLAIVQGILQRLVPACEVRAFGSRQKWTAKETSDLDLVVVGSQRLPLKTMAALKEAFEESILPMRVDVLDWNAISEEFRRVIEAGFEVIQGGEASPLAPASSPAVVPEPGRRAAGSAATPLSGGAPRNAPSNTGWIETAIGSQILLQRGVDITRADQRPGNVPVISSGGTSSYHDTSAAKGPGVVLGRKGVVGSVYFVESDYWPHDTTLWVKDFKGNHPKFVYYFFKHFSPRLANLDVGSANPTLNRNHVHPIKVEWPPLPIQKAIAHILGTLDDRIELCRRMNETLEAMARALFKDWFIDFGPVRAKMEGREPPGLSPEIAALFPSKLVDSELGEIPEGWEYKRAEEIADISIGKTPPRKETQWFMEHDHEVKWVSIRDMGSSGIFLGDTSEGLTFEAARKFNIRVIPRNTVILSFKLTVGRVAIADSDLATNEAIAHFNLAGDEFSPEYLYLYLIHFDFSQLGSTSSIATAVNSKTVKQMRILHPGKQTLSHFHSMCADWFKEIRNQQHQIASLSTLRDTLLPKLLSGELSIPEAMLQVEAVG